MVGISASQRGMLDAAYGAVLFFYGVGLAYGTYEFGLSPLVFLVAALVALTCPLWFVLRHLRARPGKHPRVRAGATILLAADSIIALILGPEMEGVALIWLLTLVIVLDYGTRAAAWFLALAVGVGSIASYAVHRDLVQAGYASVIVFFPALGILVGRLVLSDNDAREKAEAAVAQRDRALAELRQAHDRLAQQALGEQELKVAQEREVAAKDLHDGLGYRLTLASMSLEYAERVRDHDLEAAWQEIGVAHQGLRETIAWLRRWVRALHPIEEVESFGSASLESVAQMFRGTGLEVEVDVAGQEADLDSQGSLLASRVVQEALTNTLRAGSATRVLITARWGRRDLSLRVLDDGAPPEPPESTEEGFGLRSLRESSLALGGTMTAGWTQGGYALEAVIPFKRFQAVRADDVGAVRADGVVAGGEGPAFGGVEGT